MNGAPLVGATRLAAEARARVFCGLSLLSGGTPMFFRFYQDLIGLRRRLRSVRSHEIDVVLPVNGFVVLVQL